MNPATLIRRCCLISATTLASPASCDGECVDIPTPALVIAVKQLDGRAATKRRDVYLFAAGTSPRAVSSRFVESASPDNFELYDFPQAGTYGIAMDSDGCIMVSETMVHFEEVCNGTMSYLNSDDTGAVEFSSVCVDAN